MTKLVLFSDGTGNSSAKAQKTNVWRLFQALDQNRCDVLAMYDDGVGTSSNKYLAALGGAFGWGLKRNVLHLYKFVCRNYRRDDEIYGFGFSRGAFTIRVLVGLIVKEGLIAFRSEEELDRNARAAYRHYRSKCFPSWSPIVIVMRWLRNALFAVRDWARGNATYKALKRDMAAAGRIDIPIKFLGLWDTVEAYGMPVLELKRGIDWVLWPMMFGDLVLSPNVARACHALSLDDERTTFHPLLWDEKAEAEMVERKIVKAGRITQVWFAGVHSNVGGGYPQDRLSLVTLAWMMNQAIANDLPLDPYIVRRVNAEKSPYARIYDSRSGLAAYYRYAPRRIPVPEHDDKEIKPIVHGSVIMRMVHGSDRYAPITLPHQFWVLAPDGALLPMEGFAQRLMLDATKMRLAAAPSAVKAKDMLAQERADLEEAINKLARPDADAVALVWDTVWYRRLVYFMTFVLTALLVAYPFTKRWGGSVIHGMVSAIPFFGGDLAAQLETILLKASGTSRGLITPLVNAAAGFIPSYLGRWTQALVENPISFGSIVLAVLWCLYAGSMLQKRIADRARLAWHEAAGSGYQAWVRDNAKGWRNIFLATFGLLFVLCLLTADALTRIEAAVVAAIFFALWLWRIAQSRNYVRQEKSADGQKTIDSSFGLSIARRMRTSRLLVALYLGVFKYLVPMLFALALVLAGAFTVNRVVFDAVSASGRFCGNEERSDAEKPARPDSFRTDDMCWRSGLMLEAGRRYRITLTTPGDWFDGTTRADVDGFSSAGFKQWIGVPLRRWWGQNWFKPIARIGRFGNDEYVLNPIEEFDEHVYCTHPERYGGVGTNANGVSAENLAASKEDVSSYEACARCAREKPETKGSGIGAKISKKSADMLLSCSPTPAERRTLVAEITPSTTGELFLYVNDAVWILGDVSIFYRNNSGTGAIKVERVRNPQ